MAWSASASRMAYKTKRTGKGEKSIRNEPMLVIFAWLQIVPVKGVRDSTTRVALKYRLLLVLSRLYLPIMAV